MSTVLGGVIGASVAVKHGRIVVVEDHEGLRRAMERLLRARGHEAESFASAEALLESEATCDAACLILDVRLPGLSGFDLRRRLAQAGSAPPVIYVTAHEDGAARERATREGAALFLKPVDGAELLAAVDHALGRS